LERGGSYDLVGLVGIFRIKLKEGEAGKERQQKGKAKFDPALAL
jgi:hypothetical protein